MLTAAIQTPLLLDVRHLSKSFGKLRALDGVSFNIGHGEIVGLIGPNGAGKTTLLECIAGLLSRDAGDVVLPGKTESGATSAAFYVPDGITPWEAQPLEWALRFFAALHGAPPNIIPSIVDQLALTDLLHQPIGTLSRGQRKRLLIALGLLTQAPLLLLDEPFDGLDLRQVREVANVLRTHAAAGRTLFLSIHQLSDAVRVCDRMVLLGGGRVVGSGTLEEIRRAAGLPDATLEELFLALT